MAKRVRGIATLAMLTSFWTIGCAGLDLQTPLVVKSKASQDALAEAQRQERAGDLPAAREGYEQIVAAEPLNAVALHRLAVVCTRQNDHAPAAEYYNRALQVTPQDPELLTDAGFACYMRQEYAAAEALLNFALRQNPTHPRASNNLGLVLGTTGKMPEALAAFERSQPRAAALKNLSYVYQQRGEWDQALACYHEAQALDPGITIPPQLAAHTAPAMSDTVTVAGVAAAPVDTEVDAGTNVESAEVIPTAQVGEPTAIEETAADFLTDDDIEFVEPALFRDDADQPAEDWAPHTEPEVYQPPEIHSSSSGLSVPVETVSRNAEPAVVELAVVHPGWTTESVAGFGMVIEPNGDGSQKPSAVEHVWVDEVFEETNEAAVATDEPLAEIDNEDVVVAAWYGNSDDFTSPVAPTEFASTELEDPEELPVTNLLMDVSSDANRVLGLADICLVTLKDERLLVPSDPRFSEVFQEQAFFFASDDAADRFRLRPSRYVPAAGGLDVVAVHAGKAVVDGSLAYAAWYRDRLYLFESAAHLDQFRVEPAEYASLSPVGE